MAIQATLMEAWKIQQGLSPAIEDLMSPIKSGNMTTRAAAQGHVRVPVGTSQLSFSINSAVLWNRATTSIREENNQMSGFILSSLVILVQSY